MNLDIKTNSFHGLPLSEQQWKCLNTINLFIQVNDYMPSYGDLQKLHVGGHSSISRWIIMFEDRGYITRPKGFRKGEMTELGKEMLRIGSMLQGRWEYYRDAVLKVGERSYV